MSYEPGCDPFDVAPIHALLTYEQAKALVFASGTLADGYNGNRLNVDFAFHPESGKTFIVAPFGFFLSPLPLCATVEEASYYLRWHGCQRWWDRTVNCATPSR